MIAHKSSSSFSTFLSIHSTLRNLCICSLLVFVHVLLVTTAVAPRDLLEAHPSLSRSIKYLSGLSALTLLCKVFILFDLADNDTRPSIRTLSSSAGSAVDDTDKVEVDEVGNVGRYDVFALTWVELGMSMLALTGWICSIPHAMSLFEVFSYRIAMELSLLPTAYSIAFGCISINTAQLIVQLIRLRLSGSASGVWMVRTGYWERRIKLETESETEKAQM